MGNAYQQSLMKLVFFAFILSTTTIFAQHESVKLIIPELTPVAVTSRTYQPELRITYVTLANGIRLALRPMVGRENARIDSAVYIRAESLNRKNQYRGSDNANARLGGYLIQSSGVANLPSTQFKQFLNEHKTYFEATASNVSQGISLQTFPKHLEAAFQVIYAYYTQPRSDSLTIHVALQQLISRYTTSRPDNSLESITSDSLRLLLAPKGSYLTATDVMTVEPKRAIQLVKERLLNAQDFSFTIVGAFTIDEILPLLQTYLGNLPTTKKNKGVKLEDDGSFPNPRLKKTIYLPNVPSAVVSKVFLITYKQVQAKHNNLNDVYISILNKRIHEQLRKVVQKNERISVYKQPGEILNMTSFNKRKVGVQVKIECAPERIETLSQLVRAEMELLAKEPFPETELASLKQGGQRNRDYQFYSSLAWSYQLWGSSFRPDWPIRAGGERERRLENITPEIIQETALRFATTKDIMEITFLPSANHKP